MWEIILTINAAFSSFDMRPDIIILINLSLSFLVYSDFLFAFAIKMILAEQAGLTWLTNPV